MGRGQWAPLQAGGADLPTPVCSANSLGEGGERLGRDRRGEGVCFWNVLCAAFRKFINLENSNRCADKYVRQGQRRAAERSRMEIVCSVTVSPALHARVSTEKVLFKRQI